MRRIKATLFCLISLVMFVHPVGSMVSSQQIKKCRVPKDVGGKYKLVSIGHSLGKPVILGLRIVVKPTNFNRAYMIRLARRLNLEYCNDENISAVIFDDYRAASDTKVVD